MKALLDRILKALRKYPPQVAAACVALCLLGCARKSEPVAPFNATLPKTVAEPLPPVAPTPDTKNVEEAAKSIREKSERANAVAKTTLAAVAASSNPGASAIKSPLAEVVELTTSISATATALEGQIATELRDQVKASEAAHVAREAAAGRNFSASEATLKDSVDKANAAVNSRNAKITEQAEAIEKLQDAGTSRLRWILRILAIGFLIGGALGIYAGVATKIPYGMTGGFGSLFVSIALFTVAQFYDTIIETAAWVGGAALVAGIIYGAVKFLHHQKPVLNAPDTVEVPK